MICNGQHRSATTAKQQQQQHQFGLLLTFCAYYNYCLFYVEVVCCVDKKMSSLSPLDIISSCLPFAQKACEFFTSSPDPFHAVSNTVAKLEQAGFESLCDETFQGKVKAGGKYYYTVDDTALVAFAVGPKYQPGNGGFKLICAHTDSPNLRVKPKSKRTNSSGLIQLGVETYGGGLWHTWFDRDLGISGQVLVRSPSGKVVTHLLKIDRPVARISNLAIHLASADERSAFKVNKEDHLSPIIAAVILEKEATDQLTGATSSWANGHEPLLLELLAKECNVNVTDICDFDLSLFDVQPASLGGCRSEFVYSGRLDNLASCFVAVESLVSYSGSADFCQDGDISLVALFDHEEVGSESAQGAGSPIILTALGRISAALLLGADSSSNSDLYASTIRKSYMISSDQAHAHHPNYASKHEKIHAPQMNSGLVIKTNCNQRYTTNSLTRFIFREICAKANLPVQDFVVRQDCGCGSTVGPILSAKTGIRAVDCGMAQLSMHSCREVMGVVDLTHGLQCFQSFFKNFREIDNNFL